MSTFLERLKQEKEELSLKTTKIREFMRTSSFEELTIANRYLIEKQLEAMMEYENILRTRIELNN